MLLRLYSIIVLIFDLFTLIVGIWFAIVLAVYRTFKPSTLKNVKNEVAMVVGAGRGVGREIAIQLSQLGAHVACVDINPDSCRATVNKTNGTAKAFICDITCKKQVLNLVKEIKREFGEVTMLFHCCGVPSPRALEEGPVEVYDVINLSVISHFWVKKKKSSNLNIFLMVID